MFAITPRVSQEVGYLHDGGLGQLAERKLLAVIRQRRHRLLHEPLVEDEVHKILERLREFTLCRRMQGTLIQRLGGILVIVVSLLRAQVSA